MPPRVCGSRALLAGVIAVVGATVAYGGQTIGFSPGVWNGHGVFAGSPFRKHAILKFELDSKTDGSVGGVLLVKGALPVRRDVDGIGKFKLACTYNMAGAANDVTTDGDDVVSGKVLVTINDPFHHRKLHYVATFDPLSTIHTSSVLVVDTATCSRVTGRGFFRFGIVKFTATRSRGAPPTTPPAELIEEYGALLNFVNGLDSPSPDDLHEAVRRIEGFGGHLGQARSCRRDPPGFEDGLESADELFDALHNMLVRMFGAGPNGVPWTGGDLVRLLDLAVDLQILGPSSVSDPLTQTIAAALEARLEGALGDAIAEADKATIGAIARVAERAGMPLLAEHARMGLENQTPSP